MIKTIKYLPKITKARTQYCEIDKKDLEWIQMEFVRYLSIAAELDGARNQDVRSLLKLWWYKRSGTLPKGNQGQNSPLTFVGGLLNNTLFGTQRELSHIQMDAIENITATMSTFLDALKDLNLTPITDQNQSIRFQIAIL
jgi:hypothetical protein